MLPGRRRLSSGAAAPCWSRGAPAARGQTGAAFPNLPSNRNLPRRARRATRPALARGVMQLYSVEQAKSQPLEAHAAAFSTVKFSGRDLPSNVISFAQKTLKDGQVLSKLHVIELGNAPGAWQARRRGVSGAAAM